MNFEISKPTAYPYSAPPGPVLITVPVKSYLAGYFTVRVYIYEGSFWPWAGTLMDTLESTVYFSVGQSKNVQVMHQSSVGTIDRRDVGVVIYDEFTSPKNPIAQGQWDDIFYVTVPSNGELPPPEVTFIGKITKVALKVGATAEAAVFLISFNATAQNWWDGFGGWKTRLTMTMDGYSDSDIQIHIGASGSRTNQELGLGSVTPGTYSAVITLEAAGLIGQWQTLDSYNVNITVSSVGEIEPPEEKPREGIGAAVPLLIGGGLLLAALVMKPGKKR